MDFGVNFGSENAHKPGFKLIPMKSTSSIMFNFNSGLLKFSDFKMVTFSELKSFE